MIRILLLAALCIIPMCATAQSERRFESPNASVLIPHGYVEKHDDLGGAHSLATYTKGIVGRDFRGLFLAGYDAELAGTNGIPEKLLEIQDLSPQEYFEIEHSDGPITCGQERKKGNLIVVYAWFPVGKKALAIGLISRELSQQEIRAELSVIVHSVVDYENPNLDTSLKLLGLHSAIGKLIVGVLFILIFIFNVKIIADWPNGRRPSRRVLAALLICLPLLPVAFFVAYLNVEGLSLDHVKVVIFGSVTLWSISVIYSYLSPILEVRRDRRRIAALHRGVGVGFDQSRDDRSSALKPYGKSSEDDQ